MKRMTAIATACFAAVLVALLTMNVAAQDFNPLEKTFLTFSGPVELPGMTLPAGTYTFRLADTPGRNVVQVLNEDGSKTLGQFLFVPSQRRDVSGETVVTFKETAASTPPAVQFWFYPGESIGKEFVYPKDQAAKIAARTHANVLAIEGDITPDAKVSSIDETGKVTVWEREAAAAPAPAAAEAQVAAAPAPAEVAPAPAQAAAPAQPTAAAGSLAGNRGVQPEPVAQPEPRPVGTSGQAAATELPRTASPLPLSGLLGLLSLAGGLGLRAVRR